MSFLHIDAQLLRTSVLGFTTGKTVAEDRVVSEMLAALRGENQTTLTNIFRLETLIHATETDDPSWDEHVVSPEFPSDLRPITILPVLLKALLCDVAVASRGVSGRAFGMAIRFSSA